MKIKERIAKMSDYKFKNRDYLYKIFTLKDIMNANDEKSYFYDEKKVSEDIKNGMSQDWIYFFDTFLSKYSVVDFYLNLEGVLSAKSLANWFPKYVDLLRGAIIKYSKSYSQINYSAPEIELEIYNSLGENKDCGRWSDTIQGENHIFVADGRYATCLEDLKEISRTGLITFEKINDTSNPGLIYKVFLNNSIIMLYYLYKTNPHISLRQNSNDYTFLNVMFLNYLNVNHIIKLNKADRDKVKQLLRAEIFPFYDAKKHDAFINKLQNQKQYTDEIEYQFNRNLI